MNDADYSGSAVKFAKDEPVSRRSFLGVLLGFGTVVMGAALSVPLIRFALHPLLAKTTDIGWSDVGRSHEFASLTASATCASIIGFSRLPARQMKITLSTESYGGACPADTGCRTMKNDSAITDYLARPRFSKNSDRPSPNSFPAKMPLSSVFFSDSYARHICFPFSDNLFLAALYLR